MKDLNIINRIDQALKFRKHILTVVPKQASIDQITASMALASLLNQEQKLVPNKPKVTSSDSSNADLVAEAKTGKKHKKQIWRRNATVVFQGPLAKGIDFLKPDQFVSSNTDSFRDFIIKIDSKKVDKLFYKHNSIKNEVLIHLSPFRNLKGITDKDLKFSRSDINVDAVVTLGLARLADLDKQLIPPGVFHHSQLITLMAGDQPCALVDNVYDLDTEADSVTAVNPGRPVNWQKPEASCLNEMVYELAKGLKLNINQKTGTILMTGLIAATQRFKSKTTSARCLYIAAELMKTIGRDAHQLIVTNLAQDNLIPAEEKVVKTEKKVIPEPEPKPVKKAAPMTAIKKEPTAQPQVSKRRTVTIGEVANKEKVAFDKSADEINEGSRLEPSIINVDPTKKTVSLADPKKAPEPAKAKLPQAPAEPAIPVAPLSNNLLPGSDPTKAPGSPPIPSLSPATGGPAQATPALAPNPNLMLNNNLPTEAHPPTANPSPNLNPQPLATRPGQPVPGHLTPIVNPLSAANPANFYQPRPETSAFLNEETPTPQQTASMLASMQTNQPPPAS